MKKIFLIGEIGINHNGSLKLAKKIIDLAVESGFDAVKFQKRDPEVSVPNNKKQEIKNTPWGNITYLEYKKKIEFNKSEYDEINNYCKKKKIIWFASVWDLPSLKFISKYKPMFHKIPSSMLTNYNLLNEVAKKKIMTFISTGMSTISDVKRAVSIFKKHRCSFILMHCVSKYPCPTKDLNLKMIQNLKFTFKCKVGYSGHESSVSPSVYAACLGSDYIERHITIDRALWGTDQAASLGPDGMKLLRLRLDNYTLSLGNGIKKFYLEEKIKLKSMKYWQ
jgi:N-acetylneuraminate synthase